MTDPEYTYVKGQGWIVQEDFRIFEYEGEFWRITQRAPKNGELYRFTWKDLERERTLDEWVTELQRDGSFYVNPRWHNGILSADYFANGTRIPVTLEKLSDDRP